MIIEVIHKVNLKIHASSGSYRGGGELNLQTVHSLPCKQFERIVVHVNEYRGIHQNHGIHGPSSRLLGLG